MLEVVDYDFLLHIWLNEIYVKHEWYDLTLAMLQFSPLAGY
jgi:hypothetical protein